MAVLIASIMCIAMIVVGGITLSQGILSTADATAASAAEMNTRESEITQTSLTGASTSLPAADNLQAVVYNSGQLKLANYDKWDFIVQYYNAGDSYLVYWLPYTESVPGDNQWQSTGIYVNGQPEAFEPGILNPGEELALQARLNPPVGYRAARLTVATPNGITATLVCGPPTLTAHTDTVTLVGTYYYMLKGWSPADGAAVTETTSAINNRQTGRWLLYNSADPSRYARHIFPLSNINAISPSTWTVYYRGRANGWRGNTFRNASLNVDIIIRKADGTIRQTIANDVADAVFTSRNNWINISATYNFPGYTVVDETDYLEIDYYGESINTGPNGRSFILLRVDDNSLPATSQTRIAGLLWS